MSQLLSALGLIRSMIHMIMPTFESSFCIGYTVMAQTSGIIDQKALEFHTGKPSVSPAEDGSAAPVCSPRNARFSTSGKSPMEREVGRRATARQRDMLGVLSPQ